MHLGFHTNLWNVKILRIARNTWSIWPALWQGLHEFMPKSWPPLPLWRLCAVSMHWMESSQQIASPINCTRAWWNFLMRLMLLFWLYQKHVLDFGLEFPTLSTKIRKLKYTLNTNTYFRYLSMYSLYSSVMELQIYTFCAYLWPASSWKNNHQILSFQCKPWLLNNREQRSYVVQA